MNNYLIEGISGTGKTAVCKELQRQGYKAVEADEAFGFYGDPKTGIPTTKEHQLNWIWNKEKVDKTLSNKAETIFVCGGSMNQNDFNNYFEKTFTLQVDDDTLKNRLLNRKNNDFGKDPEDLARQLKWNQGVVSHAKHGGTILIDATKPVEKVVNEILNHVELIN